jgi:exodeoxyribonuclease V gamma subunit
MSAPPGLRPVSCWIAEDQTLTLQPVVTARMHLEKLLMLYWRGLQRPLPFFPRTALAYTKALQGHGKDPLGTALYAWIGSEFHEHGRGESEDPYYQLVFGSIEPLDGEFTALAGAVFQPIFAHLYDSAP